MENLVKTGMRSYLIDCHRPDIPEISFDGFSYEQAVKLLKESNVDNLFVYSKGHWGLAYYPTKVGTQHPSMARIGLDYTGEMMKAMREAGIGTGIYYSVDTDEYAATTHPEWQCIDPWGKPVQAGWKRWHRCAISHGYGDYALGMIREVLERYHPDGLFFDCYPSVMCFCPECQKRYQQITGKPMPVGDDVHAHWRELIDYEEEYYWLPFARKVRALIDEISPDTQWTTNGGNSNMPESIRALQNFHYAEPWAGNYLSGGFARGIMRNAQIGPGNLGLVYDATTPESMAQELLSIGIQGARPSLYSESLLQNGSLIEHGIRRVGKAYARVKDVENYWKGDIQADVDIFYSDLSHRYAPDNDKYDYNWWGRQSDHTHQVGSAMMMCAGRHLSYQMLQADHIDTWQPDISRPVIVPGARVVSEAAWQALYDFAEKGGNVLVCMNDVPADTQGNVVNSPAFEKLIGGTITGTDNSYDVNGAGSYTDIPGLFDFPAATVGRRLLVKPTTAQGYGRYLAPIIELDVDKKRWIAWRPPTPGTEQLPGIPLLHNKVGRGNVVLLTFNAFGMSAGALDMHTAQALQGAQSWTWPGILLGTIMDKFAQPRVTLADTPDWIVTNRFETADGMTLHLLNMHMAPGVHVLAKAQAQGYSAAEVIYVSDGEKGGVLRSCARQNGALALELDISAMYTIVKFTR